MDAAATNAIVISSLSHTGVASTWGSFEFDVVFTSTGAAANIQGSGSGVLGATGQTHAVVARAAAAGFQTVSTLADLYLTLSAGFTATSTPVVHNVSITPVNY